MVPHERGSPHHAIVVGSGAEQLSLLYPALSPSQGQDVHLLDTYM